MGSRLAVDTAIPIASSAAEAKSVAALESDPTARATSWSLMGVWGQLMLNLPHTAWMILDVILLTIGLCEAYSRLATDSAVYPHVELASAWIVLAPALLASGLVFGLYERDTLLSRSRLLLRIGLTVAAATIITYAVVYALMYAVLSRKVAAVALGSMLVGGAAIRMLACWTIQTTRRSLLLVGPGLLTQAVSEAARGGFLPHFRLLGMVDDGSESEHGPNVRRIGKTSDIPAICRQRGVSDIVVGTEAARHPEVMNWLRSCLQMGCRVTNECVFYEKATGQILVDQITPQWFLFADLKAHCDEIATLKRGMDLVAATIVLLVTLPLWPFIALAIRLEDSGPVFYSQDRVGQNGIAFRLFKFRTMRVDAEDGASVWASKNDPRVTRVGRFLRATRLDELPQLLNVLAGRMSIVGPRPERPDIVAELTKAIPYYSERHLVKPGITGWAQIGFRYGNTVEDAKRKLQFDLYYIKHMSFELDTIILFRTVGTFLRGAL